MNNNELYHYGVLGMKWGRRKARPISADSARTKELRKKKINELSNDDLKKVNERLRLEREYKTLTKKKSVGKNAVQSFIKTAATITAVTAAAATYKKVGKAALDKIGPLLVPDIKIG